MPDISEALEFLDIDTKSVSERPAKTSGRPRVAQRLDGQFKNADLNVEEVDGETDVVSLHRYEHDVLTHERKDEQPWHRMAAIMLNNGYTCKDIAKAAQVHEGTVRDLRRQRWFQQLLVTLSKETGDDIRSIIRSEAIASVEKIVELRDGAESQRVQLAAAVVLLEHDQGKPTQKVLSITASTSYASERAEYDSIQEELAFLREQRERRKQA